MVQVVKFQVNVDNKRVFLQRHFIILDSKWLIDHNIVAIILRCSLSIGV